MTGSTRPSARAKPGSRGGVEPGRRDGRRALSVGPAFLCIGAQKAGTTWLHRALGHHPRIAMPPVKEIHYFDRPSRPYALDLFSRNPPTRRRFLRWLREGAVAARKGPEPLAWCLRYFCLPRSDQWYSRLFPDAGGALGGDVTPAYARLEREGVARVHGLLPGIRVIYLLRDPVDRAWSQAAMYFRQYHGSTGIDAVEPSVVRAFVLDPFNLRNGDYDRTLAVWQEFFPAERMLLLSHDDILENPVACLLQVHAFLGLDPDPAGMPENPRERVYTKPYPAIPPELAASLARHFAPSLLALSRRECAVSPSADRWLARARSLL